MSRAVGAAKGGIRAWLMPELNDIKVELAEIKGEIKSTNTRIDSLKTEMKSGDEKLAAAIKSGDEKLAAAIKSGDEKLAAEIASLRELVNLAQRVTILEAKQKELEKQH
jgi:phage shock protein A